MPDRSLRPSRSTQAPADRCRQHVRAVRSTGRAVVTTPRKVTYTTMNAAAMDPAGCSRLARRCLFGGDGSHVGARSAGRRRPGPNSARVASSIRSPHIGPSTLAPSRRSTSPRRARAGSTLLPNSTCSLPDSANCRRQPATCSPWSPRSPSSAPRGPGWLAVRPSGNRRNGVAGQLRCWPERAEPRDRRPRRRWSRHDHHGAPIGCQRQRDHRRVRLPVEVVVHRRPRRTVRPGRPCALARHARDPDAARVPPRSAP